MPAVNFRNYGSNSPAPKHTRVADSLQRVHVIYYILLAVCALFVIRLFYLQVIRHDFYRKAALNYQLKEYQIPAERGAILAHNGSSISPLVLNETKYTLFADPVYIEDHEKAAAQIAEATGQNVSEIVELLKTPDTRYVVLAKKLDKQIAEKIEKLEILGIGTREQSYRTYPQGSLASQVLGFVNDEGLGQYGLEQYLDKSLSGAAGELRAITDSRGVPLVSNPDNIISEPQPGEDITLTIDIGMQSRVEDLLKAGLERSKSEEGSVVVMDANTGAIKAMANYPTYDPSKINEVKDISALANAAVSSPLEIGSVMKSLTTAAGLEEDVITPNTSFYNEGFVVLGDHKITDVHSSQGTQTIETTLVESLNTGAVWILKQIGRGSIGERARLTWYDYMTKHYFFGQVTGIEQAGEAAGYVPSPEDNGEAINLTYANTAFGQAMTATPVQVAAAFSSIVNGGKYYQPRLVDSIEKDGTEQVVQPIVRKDDVISEQTSKEMRDLLETVLMGNIPSASRKGYQVGGKTGTAELINPENGKYYTDRWNGTYTGFVGGDKAEYVIVTLVRVPKIPGYAGFTAAAPLFRDVSNMLLDNFGVTPKS